MLQTGTRAPNSCPPTWGALSAGGIQLPSGVSPESLIDYQRKFLNW